jgi:hypothetical protein
MSARSLGLALLVLAPGLVACFAGASADPPLNSERIAQVFGSYGVDVLSADTRLRVSSLYSTEGGVRTVRTLAIVAYPEAIAAGLAGPHAAIQAGGSIGATLQAAGWTVGKRNLYFGELAAPAGVSAVMRIAPGTAIAVHAYLLTAARDSLVLDYATIVELHHPAYLDLASLRSVYGEVRAEDADAVPAVSRLIDAGLARLAGISGPDQ